MSLDPTQLGALLTDATLREVRRAPTGLTLWLDCPRRSPAGAPLPPVQLNLMGVAAVAVSYDGALVDARPSQVAVPEGARVGDVVPWPLGAEVAIQLNSVHEDEDLALAPQVDWQGGDLAAYRACKVRLRLRAPERAAWRGLAVDAWLGAGAVTARSGGEPLDLARWQREHDAWWLHWAE
ncbi:MAG: hypothetical protein KC613_12505, partial [Myxococcales bacterium]|nr:hypothetical protein [Myxococcales bacterium]